jgi:mRNA interferase MazF
VAGKQPKQGWIYMINPYRVSLRCRAGHTHIYELTEPGEVECQISSCSLVINYSHVFRGAHPYIIWTSDEFKVDTGYIKTFVAIPLTSQRTFVGLPTVYPIVNNSQNGLMDKSYALVHQVCTIDGNCLKKPDGDWLDRMGQLEKKDRQEIEKRLKYVLGMSRDPDEDWFQQNASPELLKKVYGYILDDLKIQALDDLLDEVE